MEFVFVVPREDIFPKSYPLGLLPFGPEFRREDFEARALEGGFFVEREYAERSPHLKQIIPYALVCAGNEVLVVKRLKKGGEKRLHHKLSIGIGGHINPIDAKAETDLFSAATARELNEELTISTNFTARAVGLINDDSNPVGAVHLGLVQVVQIQGSVAIRETDQLEGRLAAATELQALHAEGANFETWSALLVEALDEFLIPATAALA